MDDCFYVCVDIGVIVFLLDGDLLFSMHMYKIGLFFDRWYLNICIFDGVRADTMLSLLGKIKFSKKILKLNKG